MSHPAIFPEGPKWIRMNLPCEMYNYCLNKIHREFTHRTINFKSLHKVLIFTEITIKSSNCIVCSWLKILYILNFATFYILLF